MLYHLMNRRGRGTMGISPRTRSGHLEVQKPYTDHDNDKSRQGMDPSLEERHSTHQFFKRDESSLNWISLCIRINFFSPSNNESNIFIHIITNFRINVFHNTHFASVQY